MEKLYTVSKDGFRPFPAEAPHPNTLCVVMCPNWNDSGYSSGVWRGSYFEGDHSDSEIFTDNIIGFIELWEA